MVDLIVEPGFDGARVSITVDGQQIANGLSAPHKVTVDFGPSATQHKISVTATAAGSKKRVQWIETINKGRLPLSVNVKPVDLGARIFQVDTTTPGDDPIKRVDLWHHGHVAATVETAPYRFTLTKEQVASGFVQVTVRTHSGDEASDFWSPSGDIHVETLQVRTVPIFVSVVDRNGVTQDNVDRSMFRIIDNNAIGTIVEFGKAFDQQISIALLLDSSASMTPTMADVAKAARDFLQRTVKKGDRTSVTSIHDVPRRRQPLTDDGTLVARAIDAIQPTGRTALYDAVESAIRELRDEKNRRAIVVLTDGTDTASMATFDEICKTARQAGIPIYFIAYDTGDMKLRDVDRMKYLATETGGFVAVATQQDLESKYREIEKDLRAQFAITYSVSASLITNEWRQVRVTMDSPKLTARTIRGYFTP